MPWLAFFTSPAARYLGLFLVVAGALGWAYLAVDGRGFDRCEREHQLASAQAAAAAHQRYLQEVARGDAIQAELVKTQRRLSDVKTEYLAYANGIAGNCPAAVGVLINSAVQGAGMPQATGQPADPAAAISAAAVAGNIAENFGRANACLSQLNALIDWHQPAKDLK